MNDRSNDYVYIIGYTTHEGWNQFITEMETTVQGLVGHWQKPNVNSGFLRLELYSEQVDYIMGRDGRGDWSALMVSMPRLESGDPHEQYASTIRYLHDHFLPYLNGNEWDMIDCSSNWGQARIMIRYSNPEIGVLIRLSVPDTCTVENVC